MTTGVEFLLVISRILQQMDSNNKIYVGNLPYSVTGDQLREIFAGIGEITEAVVISDKFSGRSKGFGFVTFADDASAQKAVDEMNNKDMSGRPLKISIARPMEKKFGPRKY